MHRPYNIYYLLQKNNYREKNRLPLSNNIISFIRDKEKLHMKMFHCFKNHIFKFEG